LHHYILYFVTEKSLQKLDDVAQRHPHLVDMLTSCHGMTGRGLQMFKDHLRDLGEDFEGVSFGSAAGAEYRHNPQQFKAPYRFVIDNPEMFLPTFHVINTQKSKEKVSPLLECPCTPQRKFDFEQGTIDGKKPDPPFGHCSAEYAATGDPSCNISTYVGGWRCCEDGVFLIDTDECEKPDCSENPVDEVYMKFIFEYEDYQPGYTRAIEPAACCDVTGDGQGTGNIEHDVPACPAGTPPEECIYVAESIQPVGYHDRQSSSDEVDLVFAGPHLHWAGISLELIDHTTNKTLCHVKYTANNSGGVMYGTGQEPGNEEGYLVGLKPCIWDAAEAPRFRRDHLLRTRAVYNATTSHTGAMSLWLMSVAAVPKVIEPAVLV